MLVDHANNFSLSQFCLKFSRSNDSFSVAQEEPASAREPNCKEERVMKQKVGRQKEQESKKVVGPRKEKCSLAILPTETLHHLFSFLQVCFDEDPDYDQINDKYTLIREGPFLSFIKWQNNSKYDNLSRIFYISLTASGEGRGGRGVNPSGQPDRFFTVFFLMTSLRKIRKVHSEN